jgi:carboxylesterase
MARILLLHGLGGTARTMAPIAAGLAARGHTVHAPTLPGHGTEPEALAEVRWADWLAAAATWPADPTAGTDTDPGTIVDVIVGQSLGGSLALALAAEGRCRAVVAINPPAPDPDAVDGLEWRQSRGHDWLDGAPLADGEEGYTRLPISALLEMATGVLATDLAAVTVPVLLVTGALDDTADPAGADLLAGAIGGPVIRLTLHYSGHVATLGPEQAALIDAIDACSRAVTG